MVLTALLWAAPQAEAAPRCWWNGYTWVCRPPAPRPWVRPWRPYYRPYAYYAPGWRYYRPYHRRW
jgi:hypothetical protein